MSIVVWDLRCPSLGFKLSNLEGFLAPKPASAFELLSTPHLGRKNALDLKGFMNQEHGVTAVKPKLGI